MRNSLFIFCILSFFGTFSYGQSLGPLFKSNWIPVNDGISNQMLPNAWAGGINACLFNTLSLNGDDLEDLLIYDRSSERPMMFVAIDNGGIIEYQYAPEYEANLPEIVNWVLLRDYNCDGLKDIFTSRPGGIRVFTNVGTGSNPQFELEEEILLSTYDFGNPFDANIYVSSVDIPAIADHDGDGDLDIITFSLSVSGVVEYHKNFSMENYGNCDSLDFELRNQCYGFFEENSASPQIDIGVECDFNVIDPKNLGSEKHGPHAGSTICTFDYDQNGFLDLLIGDITADSLTLLYNGPSMNGADSIFQLETSFPQAGLSADMHTFLASFYEDMNQDGVNDLVVTLNEDDGAEDINNVHYYRNDGLNDLPDFNFVQNNYISEGMIDIGTASTPHLFDYNSDGLMDLIVSSRGFYQINSSQFDSRLFLFENIGSLTQPMFELIDDDYASISGIGLDEYLFPTFGDLDNDGDEDMIIGDKSGHHHYFENTAGEGNIANFIVSSLQMTTSDGEELDPGQWVSPQLYDLDNDGDLDLIVGERNSNINYYENTGSPSSFSFELVNDTVGNFYVDDNFDTVGNSVPFVFNNDGSTEMIVGNDRGKLYHVNNIDGNLDGDFTILDSTFYDLNPGYLASLVLYDFNNDGMLDLITGNEAGGLNFYGSFMVGLNENTSIIDQSIQLFPNPGNDVITLSANSAIEYFEVFNLSGQRLISSSLRSNLISIQINDLSPGVYIINGRSEEGLFVRKFIKQ